MSSQLSYGSPVKICKVLDVSISVGLMIDRKKIEEIEDMCEKRVILIDFFFNFAQ